ncbi:relaxase/mobilization nuclease domain-containing protein [Mucilaginibacter pedocola]|uniref:Relaxase n=1 Tax=Mucilaginibacter pedocola TaxID=1792845 RepID=A0A1S9PKS1_9SPHI|nr:relaxase/mobilization nuclease domain-containing protein [Mucilaginibacter pedocola]OOQ61544.1 relaxase [Mucilaginibacter pedocola]
MVARIKTGKNLRGALHYNERKVTAGKAELILASGFAGNIEQLKFNQKLARFEKLISLKPSVKTNTVHISLNFDVKEKLEEETLQRIAMVYMDKIGFGDQPYLTYRHHDAAHDHLHVVTTNIQPKSSAINLHGIGWQRSEAARKAIEEEFDLVKAKGKQCKPEPAIKAIDIEKVSYGKIPTKRAISNTLNAVIDNYKFASLAELNAVLKQFNVAADRGAADSIMFQKRGLMYSLLDANGGKVGVPIKASSLYAKPTLHNLEKRFEKNRENRQEFKPSVKDRIDRVLQMHYLTRRAFTNALQKHGIAVLFRQSDMGQTYGITFVDHWKKAVFNGSELGKSYTAKAITDQFRPERTQQLTSNTLQMSKEPLSNDNGHRSTSNPLEALLAPIERSGPFLVKIQRRKKKKLNI